MARFAQPAAGDGRTQAMARIRQAMAAHPFMVAGTRRFDTEVMQVTGEDALVKTGAEGVYCAMLPGLGLGVALKIDDGATRASETVMAEILRRLGIIDATRADAIGEAVAPVVRSRKGVLVGEIHPASGWAEAIKPPES